MEKKQILFLLQDIFEYFHLLEILKHRGNDNPNLSLISFQHWIGISQKWKTVRLFKIFTKDFNYIMNFIYFH